MISVIIPVYNVEKYLRAAIDSVINQTYVDLEIILVEDKSTDLSAEILREYEGKDDRIRVIYHTENKGLSGARNTGIQAATGNYLYFMDSDDCIHPETLENMMRACRDDVQLVVGSYMDYFGDGDPIEDLEYYADEWDDTGCDNSDADTTANAADTNTVITAATSHANVNTADTTDYEGDPRGDIFDIMDSDDFDWMDLNTVDKPAKYYTGRDFLISASADQDSKTFLDSITAWGTLIARDAFGDTLYPQGRLHEDEFVTYKLIYTQEKIAYIEAPFYFYRRRKESIMDRENISSRWDAIDALEEKKDYFKTAGDEIMALKTLERLLIKLIQIFRYSREDGLSANAIDRAKNLYKKIYKNDYKPLIRDKANKRVICSRNQTKFRMFYHLRPIYMTAWKIRDSLRR